jgi:hypothetical protein
MDIIDFIVGLIGVVVLVGVGVLIYLIFKPQSKDDLQFVAYSIMVVGIAIVLPFRFYFGFRFQDAPASFETLGWSLGFGIEWVLEFLLLGLILGLIWIVISSPFILWLEKVPQNQSGIKWILLQVVFVPFAAIAVFSLVVFSVFLLVIVLYAYTSPPINYSGQNTYVYYSWVIHLLDPIVKIVVQWMSESNIVGQIGAIIGSVALLIGMVANLIKIYEFLKRKSDVSKTVSEVNSKSAIINRK